MKLLREEHHIGHPLSHFLWDMRMENLKHTNNWDSILEVPMPILNIQYIHGSIVKGLLLTHYSKR